MLKPDRRYFTVIVSLFLLLSCNLIYAGSFSAFDKTYHRSTGSPIVETDPFIVKNPSTTYTLEIYNGGLVDDEYERVSSSVIKINGQQVIGPSDFNQKVAYVSREITLNPGDFSANEISVELRGKPGGAIVIFILGVDNDPPVITPHVSPAANGANWHQSDVNVSFTCTDVITEVVSCPSPITLSAEGANQAINVTATDGAGNNTSLSLSLSIDKTAPTVVVTQTPAPNPAGWQNQSVTVSYSCHDALSGVVACPPNVIKSLEGQHTLTESVVDVADNVTNVTTGVSIDLTPPVIIASQAPLPNALGWTNQDTTVSFTCSDGLSGVSSCSPPVTVISEGQSLPIQGQALDLADNSASTILPVSLDKTAPQIASSQTPLTSDCGVNPHQKKINKPI